jgi:transcriptional regulator GlxA family with amidase domain
MVVATVAAVLLAGALAAQAPGGPAAAPVAAPPAPSAAALPRVPPPADLPRDRPLRAGFLVVDGVYGTELVAPYDVLQHTVSHTRPGIDVFTISADGGTVTTAEGLVIAAKYSFTSAPLIDILVVPSGEHTLSRESETSGDGVERAPVVGRPRNNMDSDLGNEALVAWLAKTGKSARYVVSLCDGAFLLARAGLLQGRLATTFPGDQDRFAQMFPKLELRRGVSFVHDGPVLTSVGGARSYDAALYLVDHLFGEEVARSVAKGLVLPWPPGGAEEPLPALVVRYQQVPKK